MWLNKINLNRKQSHKCSIVIDKKNSQTFNETCGVISKIPSSVLLNQYNIFLNATLLTLWCNRSVEAIHVDNSNASETWARFTSKKCTTPNLCSTSTLVKSAHKVPQNIKTKEIRSWTHVKFIHPLTFLQYATSNTKRHLYYFCF